MAEEGNGNERRRLPRGTARLRAFPVGQGICMEQSAGIIAFWGLKSGLHGQVGPGAWPMFSVSTKSSE